MRSRVALRAVVPCLALALSSGVVLNIGAVSAAGSVEPINVAGNTTPITGVDQRLPGLGTTLFFSAGPGFADRIVAYHDSGMFASDQQAVATAAGEFLGP